MLNYDKNDIFWKDFVNLPNNPYKLSTKINDFKCLLVYLSKKSDLSGWDYPITFGYMASLLRMNGAKATISIEDVRFYEPPHFSGYDLICFYPMVALLKETLELCKKVKSDFPDSKVCLFNSDQHQHEMLLCNNKSAELGKNIMDEYNCVDYILIGEAEFSFIKLCEKIYKNEDCIEDIPFCFYRLEGKILLSKKPIRPVEFGFLPFASRDLLERGVSNSINQLCPRIQASRGCCGDCRYCAESFVNITEGGRKSPVLVRDIPNVVDEVEMLYEQYKVKFFNIIDSSFEDPGEKGIRRMKLFCKEIIKRGIQCSFKIHLRADTVSKFDDDFLNLLKKAGIDILIIGIESNIEKELRSYTSKIVSINKNTNNILGLDKTDKFWILIGFIMFSACLRLEDLKEKIEFMKNINRGWDYLLMSSNLIAFKGTSYHDYLIKKGLASNSNSLSPTVRYRYEDERIKPVAHEMGSLKNKCPEIIHLNNLLYDAHNITSRYYNKMNSHLWKNEKSFIKFKEGLDQILNEVQAIYTQYLTELIDMAKIKWISEKAESLYNKRIQNFIPGILDRTKKLIDDFILSCKNTGLSTDTLYLKTWMSIINSEINSSGGNIE